MRIKQIHILVLLITMALGSAIVIKVKLTQNKNTNTIPNSIENSINPNGCPCNQSSSKNENESKNQGQVLSATTQVKEYQIPILMYHYIRDYNDSKDKIGTNLSVSPQKFEEQLRWLKDNNYQTINPRDLADPDKKSLSQISNLKLKSVILTFDDGYRDAYTEAFPILKKYGFKGVFYIITDYVEKPEHASWNELKQMKQEGMIIGSHTVSHPDLTKQYQNGLVKQLKESKITLEETLAIQVSDFCYPAGKFDEDVIAVLKETGYQTATTTQFGIADQNSDLLKLPRIRMTNETNLGVTLP